MNNKTILKDKSHEMKYEPRPIIKNNNLWL